MGKMEHLKKDLLTRISDKLLVGDGCWEWTGVRDKRGYGRMRHEDKDLFAHRALYTLLVGPIPAGMELDHLCRNPSCSRPDHLEAVTHAENINRGALRRDHLGRLGTTGTRRVIREV